MDKLNLIKKKCELMNAISSHFSNEMYLLYRTYHNNIPYEEEFKLYQQMLKIEEFLYSLHIDVKRLNPEPESELRMDIEKLTPQPEFEDIQ